AFVRDPVVHAGAFSASAAYLSAKATSQPEFMNLSPEMSRRARSLAVWATLRAYGRDGYRSMVERHLALAQRVAAQVDGAPDLERSLRLRRRARGRRRRLRGRGGHRCWRRSWSLGAGFSRLLEPAREPFHLAVAAIEPVDDLQKDLVLVHEVVHQSLRLFFCF